MEACSMPTWLPLTKLATLPTGPNSESGGAAGSARQKAMAEALAQAEARLAKASSGSVTGNTDTGADLPAQLLGLQAAITSIKATDGKGNNPATRGKGTVIQRTYHSYHETIIVSVYMSR